MKHWIARWRSSAAARDVAATAFTNVALGGVGVITGVTAARWLGPAGRGELAAIQMWPSVLAAFAILGLHDALVYFTARCPSESRRFLVASLLVACCAMPLFVAAGYLLLPRLLSTHSPRVIEASRLYLLLVPAYVFVGLPHQSLRATRQYRLWNLLRVAPPALWLLVLVLAIVRGIHEPARLTVLYVALLLCLGPAVTWLAWRPSAGPAAPTVGTVRSLLQFGFPSALATVPQFFNVKLDQLMVAAAVPSDQLGVYMVAIAWGSCIPMLSGAMSMVVSTQIASEAAAPERMRRLRRAVHHSLWLVGVPVLLLAAASPLGLVALFGSAFTAALVPAVILVVASGVNAFNSAVEELLRGCGRPAATLWAEGTSVAITFLAVLLLLPRLGLTGAALGSLAGYLAGSAVLLLHGRRFVSESTAAPREGGAFSFNVPAAALRGLRVRFARYSSELRSR